MRHKKQGNNYKFIPENKETVCDLSELAGVEIIKISSRYSKMHKIWKKLMDKHHYLGSGHLCGQQIRYLINSERHGYLGGFVFSSVAWRLQARDNWIRGYLKRLLN